MNDRIGVIDYGAGNLQNVLNSLKFIGQEGRLVASPRDLDGIGRLIFPGVGAFGDCMRRLEQQRLTEPLLDWLRADRPFFGICLGYQVLFEGSDECPETPGLGFFKGRVVRFSSRHGLKIPHMGWNQVKPVDPSAPLWKNLPDPLYFYFVHSYYPQPDDLAIANSFTHYGEDFASSAASGNVFAAQFHPERSQEAGLQLVRNFLEGSLSGAGV